ncbi:MAG: DDE-type integrase/transposase/recombinase, partial [Candidatus Scalindua sp.]|nr:DDE-type integrase/transposase/recombinase [Candidatus Scalindua sp.]
EVSLVQTPPEFEISLADTFMADLNDNVPDNLSPNHQSGLVDLQRKDKECKALASSAVSEEESKNELGMCFYLKDDVLWRQWRPPHKASDNGLWDVHQIVVPKPCRRAILEVAHGTPLAGHLGVRKTLDRIRAHFYWPGMKIDVSNYCRVCHTCQVTGKPNQKVPVSPLVPLPVFESPFTRVLIDVVGPLPKTSAGHCYLLTIMDMATRYPEAIPLRNISAPVIVRELLKFFTKMGFPYEIQSDRGTNFTSNLFEQSLKEIGIKHIKASSYHPESQGALERYHQTLKCMLRKYCEETGEDWDKGVPFLLFATREVPTESLGFSPNELIFGHQVRGPLQVLKEDLIGHNASQNLLKYVLDFKTRVTSSCEFAAQNLRIAKNAMKVWYDRRARVREFHPGDEVLVLLPLSGQPLAAKFRGPYKVLRQVGVTDYVVETPDRRKPQQVFHINMLKPYYRVPECALDIPSVAVLSQSCVSLDPVCEDDFCPLALGDIGSFGDNSLALKDLPNTLCHLSPDKASQLMYVLSQTPSVFRDVPGLTALAMHDVDVGDANPIKLSPYRVSPQRRSILQVELDYMLEHKLISRAMSQWSSPVTLVPKPGGKFRFCIDYRQVNRVTKTDTFPLPRIDDCIDQVGTSKYITKIDLMKGYWQVPLSPRAREISCFVANNQAFCCEVMPYGMKNAPATFQRLMNQLTHGIPGCVVYIDDILLFSHAWEDHLQQIALLLSRLADANLVINLPKCDFIKDTILYLGYRVGQGQVLPPNAKVESILSFPTPSSKREIQRYMGMIGYYRRFIINFSELTAPLTDLLRKDTKFSWSPKCEEAFTATKNILSTYPVLRAPDFNQTFSLAVDASNAGVGAVLLQEDQSKVLHPICYYSKKLNSAQCNYSVIEKELLALILSLQYFGVYIQSAPGPIIVFTDHHPLKFLNKFRNQNQRLTRWSLLLQEYSLDIRHIKGVHNVLADCLSRA